MKFGARVIKTGIAVTLALYVADLLNLPAPFFAGITAIFALQPSIYRSFQTVIEQIYSNIIGAIIAVIFALTLGINHFTVGLAIVITIIVMLKLKIDKTIPLVLVTIIAVTGASEDNFLQLAFLRLITVLVGVMSSFIINLIFLPPKYETRLFSSINDVSQDIIRWVRTSVQHTSTHTALKKDIDRLSDQLVKVDQWYSFYKDERSYTQKQRYAKARKLVLYRQMITATKKSLEMLKRLHYYENELMQLPEHFHLMIEDRLESLASFEERLHMKYVGKIRPESGDMSDKDAHLRRQEVMDVFVKEIGIAQTEEEQFSSYHLLHVLSAILDYEEQLEHLDLLIDSYHNYHSEEIEDNLAETL
ncbi:FUSC family protein [Indiicoccus explosivorum]|uniref:FUSC family protein n=1 Tax=Indiicoccus explosivorum TaxID=1917864 RepID=UPI000B44E61B|nr:aromatic acid exporter family protein [Indiicoccus explosivorum]